MSTDTATNSDVAVVQAGFEAFGRGDLEAVRATYHPDATWNHRNEDRFAGVKSGIDDILAFMGESSQLTDGTLRVSPQEVMADGSGHVAVHAVVTASRPDGRSFESPQILFITIEDGRVRSVDQFIGNPAEVTAFWA